MYSDLFCRIYDTLGWNAYPEELAEQIWRWLRLRGRPAESCLDLGCGTGVLCAGLAAHGLDTLGTDLSPGMIALARERFPALRFETADMTDFSLPRRFDLITCTGDALNHLPEPEDLRRAFCCVRAALSEGGVFLFDLLCEGEIPSPEPFELDFSDALKARFRVERSGDTVRLLVEARENGVPTLRETVTERLYDPALVLALLRETGFRKAELTHALLPDAPADAATWFVVAE